MRRKACEVNNPEKIKKILSSVPVGRLATNGADGYPYITPVNFVFYEERIYFHSAPKGEKLVGVGGWMAPQDATAEFGRETLEAAAAIAIAEVHHRLEHTSMYRGHGQCLRQGLWNQG